MVNIPWCHSCDKPDGLCTCFEDDAPKKVKEQILDVNGDELIKCHFSRKELEAMLEGIRLIRIETSRNEYFPKIFLESVSSMRGKFASYLKKSGSRKTF